MPSRRAWVVLALCMFVAAAGVAGVTTALHVNHLVPAVMHSLAEIDEGIPSTLRVPNPPMPLHLCMVVDSAEQAVPPLTAEIITEGGVMLSTSPVSGWTGRMGRIYRRVLRFDPGSERTLSVTVRVDPEHRVGGEDFVIFRDPRAVTTTASDRAMPWWLASGALAAGSVVAIFAAVLTSPRLEHAESP